MFSCLRVLRSFAMLLPRSPIQSSWTLRKKQFERLSKPGSIASVALSQDGCGCPFGATTLGFMWTNDQCWPWAMWISHLCWQVFYIIKPGKCNKRRCDHATPFAIRNLIKLIPQCLHMDWLFVCFFCWAHSNSWQSYKIFNCWLKNMENNAPPITKAVDDFK